MLCLKYTLIKKNKIKTILKLALIKDSLKVFIKKAIHFLMPYQFKDILNPIIVEVRSFM